MKLSVIIPVYNEEATLAEILRRVREVGVHEIIAVDDGSTDGSWAALQDALAADPELKLLRHEANRGKGAAIKTAIGSVTGDAVIIQDADLEYNPEEYQALIEPIEAGRAAVVYGSRILGGNAASYRRYYWGGRVLSAFTSALFGRRVTDQHTCYKVFETKLLQSLPLRETGFGFCAEVTALLLKKGVHVEEVPISYQPRSIGQGKKIRWQDGLRALWIIARHRFAGPPNDD
ncbi:MAG: glycosyltransferase family 2 protein [Planctomycetes bacterium]|nr:glycosyltransferase family 2 protein [Planctomycetota bacterium]